jgi:hypothetical protein
VQYLKPELCITAGYCPAPSMLPLHSSGGSLLAQ